MQENTENKPICLGNIYGNVYGTGYAGNVWSVGGLCPTLRTFQGGNAQPLVIVKHERKDKDKTGN